MRQVKKQHFKVEFWNWGPITMNIYIYIILYNDIWTVYSMYYWGTVNTWREKLLQIAINLIKQAVASIGWVAEYCKKYSNYTLWLSV